MEACCSTAKKAAAGRFHVRGREVSHHASEGCEAAQQELGDARLRDDAGDGGGAKEGAQPAAGGEDAAAQGAPQDGCAHTPAPCCLSPVAQPAVAQPAAAPSSARCRAILRANHGGTVVSFEPTRTWSTTNAAWIPKHTTKISLTSKECAVCFDFVDVLEIPARNIQLEAGCRRTLWM